MAATVSVTANQVIWPEGHLRGKFINVTGDSTYAAGGYTITASQCGLSRITGCIQCGVAPATTPASTATTGRLVMTVIDPNGASISVRFMGPPATSATTAEFAETTDTDLSTTTAQLLVIGV